MIIRVNETQITYRAEAEDKVRFHPTDLNRQYIEEAYNFAMNMTFNKVGEHRENRTGGIRKRKNGEIFANAFQGKTAEFAIYDFLRRELNWDPEYPDLREYQRGEWDVQDIESNGLSISIKSTKTYGNLLLLEAGDYDNIGNYIPNNTGYDLFVLSRIGRSTDQKSSEDIMKSHRLLYSNNLNSEEQNILCREIKDACWQYDIPGYITRNDLTEIIHRGNVVENAEGIRFGFIPQKAILNVNTSMDADNYFFVCSDLRNLNNLDI